MIGRLTGMVVDEDAEGGVVLDVNGVGYEVTVPLGTLGQARGNVPSDSPRLTLFIHTHVREDTFLLYGFSSANERRAFRTLLGVSSIGPRLALAILSVLPAAELSKTVQGRDARALISVPGVGKKSAERILLELRDKLTFAAAETSSNLGDVSRSTGPVGQQVVEGLTRMGFKPSEAERAVASLGESVEGRSIGEIFRESLALLRH